MILSNDPLGQAILDFSTNGKAENIIVASDLCDDDVIPVDYLFRSFDEMPEMEQIALQNCSGSILDVGAGAGIHAKYLKENGNSIKAIDISPGAVSYMQSQGLDAEVADFFQLKNQAYDTLLMLMNGIGIAGSLSNLENTLNHAKSLLSPNGKIIFDSTDIHYLYEDEDGGMWVDLGSEYYGNFKFQMKYGQHETPWFDWLYIDQNKMTEVAQKCGFHVEILFEDESQYLSQLTRND